jgi:hypothetical protein
MAIPTPALEDIQTALMDARAALWNKMDRDSENHYNTFIFQPDYPGQTPLEKWAASAWGRDDQALLDRLNAAITTVENELSGFNDQ